MCEMPPIDIAPYTGTTDRPIAALESRRLDLVVGGVPLQLQILWRSAGYLTPVVFLHGFGSTKEDWADVVRQRAFDGRPVLAWDAPGFGDTNCDDLSRLSIPFIAATARAMLDVCGIHRCHLVGHSMGGLTALVLADADSGRFAGFVDIEGNVAPEDCFLSRQIVDYPDDDAERFLDDFIARVHRSPASASALYAASLRHKVRAGAVPGVFRSMVELSDHGRLLDRFLALPMRRLFMFGDENRALSYLATMHAAGVALSEIPHCGHFPMYSNPPVMWAAIGRFLEQADPD